MNIERFVGDEALEVGRFDERGHTDCVKVLTGDQDKADQIAQRVGHGNDLGRPTGNGPAYGLAFGSPFCALTMTMDFDDCAVDHRVFHVGITRKRLEKPLKNPGFCPVTIALEHRVPLAKPGRQIAPRRTRARNPQHTLNK